MSASKRLELLEEVAARARAVQAWDWSDCDDDARADHEALEAALAELAKLDACPACQGGNGAENSPNRPHN